MYGMKDPLMQMNRREPFASYTDDWHMRLVLETV
jgi:hypothetical protein